MKTITLFRGYVVAIILTVYLLPFMTSAQTCVTTIATYPYAESFEGSGTGGIGAWVQDTGDNGDWATDIGQTPSGGTGPLNASDLNYYIYTEATSGYFPNAPGNPNRTAFLNSPCFNLTGLTTPQFSFDYHMFGGNMGTLKIQVSTNNGASWADIGWTRTGQQQAGGGTAWLGATIDLTAYAGTTIKLRFHGTTGNGYQSDMSVDNVNLIDTSTPVSCTSTINTYPYTEGFEGSGSGGLGAWIQAAGDDGNWTNRSGGTPSGSTGPSAATEGSYYMFTEATFSLSPGSPNKTAFLDSPCFDLTGLLNPDFNFSYHMYGADMGTLRVRVSTDNGATFTDIGWSRTGQQNSGHTDPWLSATINLAAYIGQTIVLRFHGLTGSGYRSDMAIDGISLVDSVPLPEMNVVGNATSIIDGDITPDVADDTEFGNMDVIAGTVVRTFTIENSGTAALNLTDASPYVVIGGAHAADFTITTIPANTIAAGGNTTFQITFDPSAVGLRSATISIANDDSDENPYNFNIQGTGTTVIPEIDITGMGVTIVDGDTTPDVADDTDFGDNIVGFATTTHTFTITNTGGGSLNLTSPFPHVVITGANAADFTLTANPTTPIAGLASTTFNITFNPSALGIRTATITITNNDTSETIYNFDIQGNGTGSAPEIEVSGNGNIILNGDITPTYVDNTEFGNVVVLSSSENVFTINNLGSQGLNLTGLAPYITITGANAAEFTVTAIPANPILALSSTTFNITFTPTALGLRTATISIANDDSDENPYTFDIQGTGATAITISPGGVSSNLQLWLKANDGAGTVDGQALGTWFDQAFSNDATVNLAGQEPTWRDNINYNMNFNPVVDFDNNVNAPADGDYSYDDLSTEFLQGTGGLYTQDLFIVVVPDMTINSTFGYMDLLGGDENPGSNETDATGVGFGTYSARFSNEVITYCVGTTSSGNGYGVTHNTGGASFSDPMIINTRNNAGATQQELYMNANNIETLQNDVPDFSNVNNSRYWIGRTEGYEASTDARIVEIISYSSRKDDATERNRVQSYLGLKYGITLGVNGTAMNYYDSNGNIIWNSGLNFGYNYDIAGIARDDASDLIQKQSKSINSTAAVTIGLGDVALTNNANSSSFNANRDYLIWGHDGNSLAVAPPSSDITILLGPTTTTTITQRTLRTWKIVESGGDVPTVEISVFQSDLAGLPALVGNDAYVMVVADDDAFTSNVETVFLNSGVFNGQAVQEITYDFDGTRYFTIGVAHETVEPRHSSFDGSNDYTLIGNGIDLTGDFSVSAWVRTTGPNSLNTNKTIVSKKGLSGGYQFAIRNDNTVEFNVGIGAANRVRSNTPITTGTWHHVSVTYDGSNANLYIDGVLDQANAMNSPVSSSERFTIGAIYESKNVIYDHFDGDIDEVRVWDSFLGVTEIRYIMNQEIEKSGASMVNGSVIPNTIAKNDINSRAWSDLLAYYDMNSYLGTHLNDVSDNNNRGSLIVPNNFNIEAQTAPLPYISLADGDWDASGTWVNGTLYYMPGTSSIVDNTMTIDWNIAQTLHNITIDNGSLPIGNANNRSVLGLLTDANELSVLGDNGLTVTHYLNLDGLIDLEGESQLIQTDNSELDISSSGSLERDQQGTADLYTYNYWSSPVGTINTTANNQSYTIPSLLREGTTPSAPGALNFITTGYDGNPAPIGVADYWIWKFANQSGNDATDYSFWQHIRSAGNMLVGEGFTMKGPGTGGIATPQNYVFTGKPNNNDISLTINAGNDYLIGNPYPSALDSHEFLDDNPLTGGTLYFWEHWGGGSHLLADYQGGYAQYNYSGGTGAASYGTNDPDVGTGGTPTKLPGRYIPVAQGFFVAGAVNGTINFENDQRAFVTEAGASSVFVRNSSAQASRTEEEDNRMKFRIGFNSINEIHRQLLLTVDNNASADVDWGYDGIIKEEQIDDMYWMIDNEKYIIQGTNQVDVQTIVPLGIHTRDEGLNEIMIDKLENVPNDVAIYLHDKDLEIYHDLRIGNYQIYLLAGEYTDRFEIVFNNDDPSLDIADESISDSFEIHYSNNDKNIVILNPNSILIESMEIFNILGQSLQAIDEIPNDNVSRIRVRNLSSGTYIIKLHTELGKISKKVLVR